MNVSKKLYFVLMYVTFYLLSITNSKYIKRKKRFLRLNVISANGISRNFGTHDFFSTNDLYMHVSFSWRFYDPVFPFCRHDSLTADDVREVRSALVNVFMGLWDN